MDNYIELAGRTESPNYYADRVPLDYIVDFFFRIQQIGIEADQLKRTLYYGTDSDKFEKPDKAYIPTLESLGLNGRVLHALLGTLSESAELLDLVQQPQAECTLQFSEELGDLEWYTALFYRALALDPKDVRTANILKLQKRFPNKFNEKDAVQRDLQAESDVLSAALSQGA